MTAGGPGSGTWLILVGPVNPDASEIALDAIQHLRGRVRLEVRALPVLDEDGPWHARALRRAGEPFWLIVHDGQLRSVLRGQRDPAALVAALERVGRRLSGP